MIKISNVSKSFGERVLFEDVTFNVNRRERLGLVGRNGHGKTTILRLILGKTQADGGRIMVTVKQEYGNLQIQVQDNGDGIAPDQVPLVFDRLYSGDPSRQRQGSSTGLGLAIAKTLIEAHRGTITAGSRGKDQGSTFTIELPL